MMERIASTNVIDFDYICKTKLRSYIAEQVSFTRVICNRIGYSGV